MTNMKDEYEWKPTPTVNLGTKNYTAQLTHLIIKKGIILSTQKRGHYK